MVVLELNDWDYICEDGVWVDWYGVGLNNEEVFFVFILFFGNVFQYVVEIVYKNGNFGSVVIIEDVSGNFYNLVGNMFLGISFSVKVYWGVIFGFILQIIY